MFYVATLISSPARPAVTDDLAQKVARYLPHGRPVDWLSAGRGDGYRVSGEEFEGASVGEADSAAQGPRAGYPRHRRRRAGRRRHPAAGGPAQEAVPRRHGFHHDRSGMHRRTGRLCRLQGPGRRRSPSAPCAARSRSSRRCASGSRCSKACPQRVIDTVIAERIRLTPGGPHSGRHHAGAWRLYVSRVRRLHRVHVEDRRA